MDELRRIEQFLYDEAGLLDNPDLDRWIELYTEDGTYWMPVIENQEDPVNQRAGRQEPLRQAVLVVTVEQQRVDLLALSSPEHALEIDAVTGAVAVQPLSDEGRGEARHHRGF